MRARVFCALGLLGAGACVGDTTSSTTDSGSDASSDASVDVGAADAPSDGADASDGAPTFDVKSIAGLSLWLNAGVGVTTNASSVTVWADQSGNGNDAKPGTGEPTDPTLVASAIHAQPAVHFENGAHVEMLDSSSLELGVGDFSLTIVMQTTTDPTNNNYGLVFAKQSVASGFPGVAVFMDLPSQKTSFYGQVSTAQWTATSATGLNDGKARVYGFRRVGATLTMRVNGSIDGTFVPDAATVDVSAVGIPARMGAGGEGTSASQIFTGDVAEVVLVKGSIPDSTLVALENYLKGRYGL